MTRAARRGTFCRGGYYNGMAALSVLSGVFGLFLIILTLWEGFETVVLPRSVTRPLRLSRQFYKLSWPVWKAVGMRLPSGTTRQQFMGIFGPLSLPVLLSLGRPADLRLRFRGLGAAAGVYDTRPWS